MGIKNLVNFAEPHCYNIVWQRILHQAGGNPLHLGVANKRQLTRRCDQCPAEHGEEG